jgi:hypothetical protein
MRWASRTIWWVKPHSLSYQAITLTSVPSTALHRRGPAALQHLDGEALPHVARCQAGAEGDEEVGPGGVALAHEGATDPRGPSGGRSRGIVLARGSC